MAVDSASGTLLAKSAENGDVKWLDYATFFSSYAPKFF